MKIEREKFIFYSAMLVR